MKLFIGIPVYMGDDQYLPAVLMSLMDQQIRTIKNTKDITVFILDTGSTSIMRQPYWVSMFTLLSLKYNVQYELDTDDSHKVFLDQREYMMRKASSLGFHFYLSLDSDVVFRFPDSLEACMQLIQAGNGNFDFFGGFVSNIDSASEYIKHGEYPRDWEFQSIPLPPQDHTFTEEEMYRCYDVGEGDTLYNTSFGPMGLSLYSLRSVRDIDFFSGMRTRFRKFFSSNSYLTFPEEIFLSRKLAHGFCTPRFSGYHLGSHKFRWATQCAEYIADVFRRDN